MPLLENGLRVTDRWTARADDQPIPAGGPVLVSFDRLTAEHEALLARPDPLGVRLSNDRPVADLVALLGGDINRLDLIVLAFPTFKDGRAYTQARQARETHGYRGSLRATGDVLRDQLFFMSRCGFDAVELDSADPEADWQAAMTDFAGVYQPTGDGRAPISALRRLTQGRKGVAA